MSDLDQPFSLQGKVALVTGAARGLGAVTAEVLARAGARVVLSDIQKRARGMESGSIRSAPDTLKHRWCSRL